MTQPPPIPSSGEPSDSVPPKRSRFRLPELDVRSCIAMNLLACPGLGTVLARRRGGYLQLIVMVIGFLLAMTFLLGYLRLELRMAMSGSRWSDEQIHELAWMGWWGFGLCGVAWIWAAVSSFQIWRSRPVGTGRI